MVKRLTLKDKAQLVAEQLPGYTLDFTGKVIEAPVCPLCGQPMDAWAKTDTISMNGREVKVHKVCPGGGG